MTKEERIELARSLHSKGCNCCQSVLLTYVDLLPIDSQSASMVSSGFGRGISGCRQVCGCVSGMAMVCGLTGHTGDLRLLIEKFRAEQGDIVCERLLASGKKPCREMIADTAGLLSELV